MPLRKYEAGSSYFATGWEDKKITLKSDMVRISASQMPGGEVGRYRSYH